MTFDYSMEMTYLITIIILKSIEMLRDLIIETLGYALSDFVGLQFLFDLVTDFIHE